MMEVLVRGAVALGLDLSQAQTELFEAYYRELVAWNEKFNLTSVIAYDEVQAKHFADSLTVLPLLKELFPSPPVPLRVIDVGAGAGLPGLPLKIVLPDISLVLIESTAKKASFLEYTVKALGLSKVEVVVGRAEELAHSPTYREAFDLCLARAVAALPTLIELVLPFARTGGFFVAHKGPDVAGEVKSSANAVKMLGGKLRETRKVQLDHILSPRNLVIIEKVSRTPAIYPRRSGLPSKRPL